MRVFKTLDMCEQDDGSVRDNTTALDVGAAANGRRGSESAGLDIGD